MQSVTSRIWTRVTVSISYDDNDYNTGTSISLYLGFQFFLVLDKKFDVVHMHQVVNLFLWFTEFVSGCAFPKDVVECHHGYH